LIVVVVTIASLVACSGCSADAEAPADEEAASTESLRKTVLHHEELIAACMRAEGFDYIAAVPFDVILEETRAEAEANGDDVAAALEAVETPEDPNDAIVRALTEDEQLAYADAYWGTDEVGGCYYSTYEEAWGVDIVELAGDLDDKLTDAEDRIAADPRVIEAKEAYVACVRDGGYLVASVDDINAYRSKHEAATVEAIQAGGQVDIHPDDPLWQAFEEEMDEFLALRDSCEADYLEVVQPIENDYLGNTG
jgi:hypothetical protein